MTKIAFLGLGAMGSRMAARLLAAGHSLTIWNRSPAAMAPLAQAGAMRAASPREAAMGAEFVISMVRDDAAARQVWLDAKEGAIQGLGKGAIAIEASTVTPGWIDELGVAITQSGGALLDAPVAGSRPQAEAGQLIFMVGGEKPALEKAQPMLLAMGGAIHHVGRLGQGAVLKLAVNAYFAAQLASMAELLGFLGKSGLPAPEAAAMLAGFPVVSPALAGAAKMMAAGETSPLFTIDLIEKDLGYALDAAKNVGADLANARATRDAFAAAQAAGLGSRNVTGLAAIYA